MAAVLLLVEAIEPTQGVVAVETRHSRARHFLAIAIAATATTVASAAAATVIPLQFIAAALPLQVIAAAFPLPQRQLSAILINVRRDQKR